jgi:hypothetical protein
MNRLSRTFAAVAATTMMLSATVPALAAEDTTVATDVSAKASPIKHRRVASVRHIRHVAAVTPLQRNLGCSGDWCGRQFVLFLGIGF